MGLYLSLDIDECELGQDGCEVMCNNTVGSYVCLCHDGYKLNADRRTCDGMYNTAQFYSVLNQGLYRLLQKKRGQATKHLQVVC